MENTPVDLEMADALDDSRLADVLQDPPERIHSGPRPSQAAFSDSNMSEGTSRSPSSTGRVDANDHHLSPEPPAHRSSTSRTSYWDPEPGFAHINGDIGGPGYNETRVDVITVPCPGADPVETWTRDPLKDGFFGKILDNQLTEHLALTELAGDAVLSPGIGTNFSKAAPLWVKQGIRRYASTARVLLYRHRELSDSTDLDSLARDLLDKVLLARDRRDDSQQSRPLFFIAHSIGGLVVKKALLIANQDDHYRRTVLYNCHGVSFFATPHRGSSYMSMSHLSDSIQLLLHLHKRLPRSLASSLRVGSKSLLKMHDDFTDMSSEMRVWTFYETKGSRLSGSGRGPTNEVEFSAPIVSIKSAIVGVRQEIIYSSLESDHAHCASFGKSNPRTLNVFLIDLATAIRKAEALSHTEHTQLNLKKEVKVEMIGFYDDPDGLESDIRLYIQKSHLADFLRKGPEKCLEERLRRMSPPPGSGQPQISGRRPSLGSGGLIDNVQRVLRSISRSPERGQAPSPDITFTPSVAAEEPSSVPPARPFHRLSIPVPVLRGSRRPSSRGSNCTTSTMSEPISQRASMDGPSGIVNEEGPRCKSDTDQTALGITSGSRSQRHSVASALHDLTAGFSRPNATKRRILWIHMPFTNPHWVKAIFEKLSETHKQNFSKLFNSENWVSKHVQGRHSRSQPSFVKPAVNYISADLAPSPRPSNTGSLPSITGSSPSCLYLYLPYLHFDTYKHVVRRRNLIAKRLSNGRARPVPKDIADLASLELRTIWEQVGHDPPLNHRRTLDQFGYPSLKETHSRDDDQMLYKLTKEAEPYPPPVALTTEQQPGMLKMEREYSSGTKLLHEMIEKDKQPVAADSDDVEQDLRDGNLLMVDQLWLWAIENSTLTTFFPQRESRPSEGAMFQQADLRDSIYHELNGDLTGRCENGLDLAAFVVLHAVTVLLDRSSHPDLEVFRIFEEATGMLTERMTSNLKKFRMQTFRDFESGSDGEPEDDTAASIKKRHRRETERAERENWENTSALLELRDMEDELNTLSRLFDTQTAIVSRMAEIYDGDGLKEKTHFGQGYLQEALSSLTEYKAQTTEMLDRVRATRGDYEKLLEMAQRQAQVDDVRWSRLQTELASSQNLSVMIFTIFTVIFLPLSFFTSLFGMNTFDWAGDPTSAYPTLGRIGVISLPASALVIGATLVAAFSAHMQLAAKAVWRGVRRLQPAALRRAAERRREDREKEAMRVLSRRRKEKGYDFWAAMRRQRTRSWSDIPELNRGLERAGTGLESSGSGTGGKGVGVARRAGKK